LAPNQPDTWDLNSTAEFINVPLALNLFRFDLDLGNKKINQFSSLWEETCAVILANTVESQLKY
jgi:hypothetical protein